MGAAISSFGKSFGTLTDHPAVAIAALVVLVPATILNLVLNFIPIVGPILASVLIAPLMLASILAMAHSAVNGTPRFGDLVDGISEYGPSMIGAYAIFFGIMFVFGMVASVLFFFVIFAGSAASAGAESADMMAATGVGTLAIFAIGMLVYFLVLLFVQFIDVAFVAGNASAISAYSVAWKLVTSSPLSAIGYSLLRWFVLPLPAIVILGGVGGLGWVAFGEEQLMLVLALVGVASLIVLPAIWGWQFLYHVTYFEELDRQYGLSDPA